jgi:cystathionine gamma-synthase
MSTLRPATRAVRAGIDRDTAFGAVDAAAGAVEQFQLRRLQREAPLRLHAQRQSDARPAGRALAELEGGAGGVVTSTGMAAITLVLHALLQPGDRWSCRTMGTAAAGGCSTHWRAKGISSWSPPTSPIRARSPRRWRIRRKLVWIETPSNPLLRITDLRFVIDAAHRAGALAVVDNTFLSPALQTPIAFGADLVVHSTTKYINGHSDVVGGAVVSASARLHEQLTWWANALA